MDARKAVITEAEVLPLLSKAAKVVVASGKKTLTFSPGQDDNGLLLQKATGRTGNLRAPALRVGDIFYIGYNDEIYTRLLMG